MLDALIPAAQHIEANLTDANAKECVAAAAQKASEGAESTANMARKKSLVLNTKVCGGRFFDLAHICTY